MREKTKWILVGIAWLILLGMIILVDMKTPDLRYPDSPIGNHVEVGHVVNVDDEVATVEIVNITMYAPKEELQVGDVVRVITDEQGNLLWVERTVK